MPPYLHYAALDGDHVLRGERGEGTDVLHERFRDAFGRPPTRILGVLRDGEDGPQGDVVWERRTANPHAGPEAAASPKETR